MGERCFRKHTCSTTGDSRFEPGSPYQQLVGSCNDNLLWFIWVWVLGGCLSYAERERIVKAVKHTDVGGDVRAK